MSDLEKLKSIDSLGSPEVNGEIAEMILKVLESVRMNAQQNFEQFPREESPLERISESKNREEWLKSEFAQYSPEDPNSLIKSFARILLKKNILTPQEFFVLSRRLPFPGEEELSFSKISSKMNNVTSTRLQEVRDTASEKVACLALPILYFSHKENREYPEKASLFYLGLSTQARNSLLRFRLKGAIETIEDLCSRTEQELMKIKNFGEKCLEDVKNCLGKLGLSLKSETRY